MKLNVEAIKTRESGALKELLEVVRKSARAGCVKVGAEYMEDDVAQDVFMLFIDKLVYKFDESYNAEPILIEASRRVALALMRSSRAATEISIEEAAGLSDSGIDVINARNSLHGWPGSPQFTEDENPVSLTERVQAMEKIKMEFPGVVAQTRELRRIEPTALVRKRQSGTRKLSPSAARLREIRQELGRTQELFAAQLGIPTATLLSYEYGRTANVPRATIEGAEEMFKRDRAGAERNRLHASRSMKDVIRGWTDKLKVEAGDFKTLAAVVGVSESTIYRWRDEVMRPRSRELVIYERNVAEAALRMTTPGKGKGARK